MCPAGNFTGFITPLELCAPIMSVQQAPQQHFVMQAPPTSNHIGLASSSFGVLSSSRDYLWLPCLHRDTFLDILSRMKSTLSPFQEFCNRRYPDITLKTEINVLKTLEEKLFFSRESRQVFFHHLLEDGTSLIRISIEMIYHTRNKCHRKVICSLCCNIYHLQKS